MAGGGIRGPRLGTKLLILMSAALVVMPWFSYLYLSEMEDFLIDSQANAQILTAEGISTLFNGRSDLFNELPLTPEGYEQLYAHPLTNPIRIDGKESDWEAVSEYFVSFGTPPSEAGASDEPEIDNQFQLLLGEHRDQVYALVRILDESRIYRDRNILRLDLSDHVRITFTGQDGQIKRLVITATEPGVTTAYLVDEDWRYAIRGEPENRVPGFLTETDDGYTLEFRIPLELLGSTRHFGLAVVDVDDAGSRSIESITGTLPSAAAGQSLGLVLLKSPEVLRIVEGLGYSGANIQVIDNQRRVRAEVGSYRRGEVTPPAESELTWWEAWLQFVAWIFDPLYRVVDISLREDAYDREDKVIIAALAGNPGYQRLLDDNEGEVIIAAHPIIDESEVIGTIVLRQNTNRILELRRDALQRIVNFSVLSLFIFVGLILFFSVRLAGRIRRLGAEATGAIDVYGRLRTNRLTAETDSGDEIGDLARSISSMLTRLHQHNQFLENMPRTLRHEINNPLNTLSTSLQNLESGTEADKGRYLEAAKRGVMRIGMIVQNLADAASLEDALEAEEFEVVDLHQLVENYLNNCRNVHTGNGFEYRGTNLPVLSMVSDYRIEQLLDKLIDNAVDFAYPSSTITVGLTTTDSELTLYVNNVGPAIPKENLRSIFDSMVSERESNPDNRLHFGMGLYVVRVIAEHHGGSVSAANLPGGNGVSISVKLPRHRVARPETVAAG